MYLKLFSTKKTGIFGDSSKKSFCRFCNLKWGKLQAVFSETSGRK